VLVAAVVAIVVGWFNWLGRDDTRSTGAATEAST
jgi:hypothetical protein